jgi:hypothetical protein
MLFLLAVTFGVCGKAQDKKIRFHSINSAGLLIGKSNTDMMLQTLNGIAYKNYFSGIGFGIDYYHYNSYPLFFDQQICFGKKKSAFIYGDLGYNFTAKNKPGKDIYYYNTYHFSGGVFTGVGVGTKIKFAKSNFFLLSIGYSYKELNLKIGTNGPADGVDYSSYKFGNGRIVLKGGVDF